MTDRVPAYEGTEPYVFVSYAHKNSQQVLDVIKQLYDNKYRVWYDEGIAPGSEWPKNIEKHLQGASAVIACISKESLASPNCENEVVNSNPNERQVFQLLLDGSSHKLLSDCKKVKNAEEIMSHLDESYIGDGVTGYHADMGISGGRNRWTGLIVLAACLVLALGAGIYGLNAGWFDNYLPGLQEQAVVTPAPEEEIIEVNNIITQAAAQQTDEDLMKPVQFKTEEAKNALSNITGINSENSDEDLTYFSLTTIPIDEVYLDNANEELLSLMKYFKNLNSLHITGGDIKSLEPLTSCPHLKKVFLSYGIFPVTIPEKKQFEVLYENR